MASRGKKKTTMAKLTRESRLRERRLEKQIRKDDRKSAAADRREAGDSIDIAEDGYGVLAGEELAAVGDEQLVVVTEDQ